MGSALMELFKCPTCFQEKPLDGFYPSSSRPSGRSYHCRECNSIKTREWREKNAEKNRARILKWKRENPRRWNEIRNRAHYKTHYGMTLEGYGLLFEQQGGQCAICGTDNPGINPRTKRRMVAFCVDHDHKTGAIRGLLCLGCNLALGHVECNRAFLDGAGAYLKRHGCVGVALDGNDSN